MHMELRLSGHLVCGVDYTFAGEVVLAPLCWCVQHCQVLMRVQGTSSQLESQRRQGRGIGESRAC